MLKKIILFLLVVMMFFSLLGCEPQPTEIVNEVAETTTVDIKRETTIDEELKEKEKPVVEVKEPEVPVVDENKLIDGEGCIYEINAKYTFPNSELILKRIKLKSESFGYLMFFDFDITNTSNSSISWRIQDSGNLLGYIEAEELGKEEIGGNSNYYDEDFNSNRDTFGYAELKLGETYTGHKLGIFDNCTLDVKWVSLKEKEPMTITLYYKVNDIKYPFEIRLNQD